MFLLGGAYLGGTTSGHRVHGALAEVRRGFHVRFGLVVVGHIDCSIEEFGMIVRNYYSAQFLD